MESLERFENLKNVFKKLCHRTIDEQFTPRTEAAEQRAQLIYCVGVHTGRRVRPISVAAYKSVSDFSGMVLRV